MRVKSSMLSLTLFLFAAVCVIQAQERPAKPVIPERLPVRASAEQSSQPAIYYRLDFVIREMDGNKPVDIRNYSVWIQSGDQGNMSAGSEVPYPSAVTNGVNYRSIGVTIICILKERNDRPQLELRLNISDALPPEKDSDMPAFRKISLDSKTLLVLNKPTTVGIVEDPGSRHRYQVDVTATRLE